MLSLYDMTFFGCIAMAVLEIKRNSEGFFHMRRGLEPILI